MHELKKTKIVVFGTGAVGGYYGGMLVKAGFDVTFVARGKNYEVLKKNGLTLIVDGKRENFPINVVETCRGMSPFDYIFICVKSFDTKFVAEHIKPIVGENTMVISFQNGVENEDIISGVIGEKNIIGGLAFVASALIEPGIINQFGYNGCLLGELNYKKTKRVTDLQNIFLESGVACLISDDIRADMWNKLVWNASFNSISVLTGKTVDKILEEDLDQIKKIMHEVKEVALAHNINIRPDTVEFNLNRSKGFTGFKTSTLQDYEKGKPIELEGLVGVVIRKAREKNISVSATEKIYDELKQKTFFHS